MRRDTTTPAIIRFVREELLDLLASIEGETESVPVSRVESVCVVVVVLVVVGVVVIVVIVDVGVGEV